VAAEGKKKPKGKGWKGVLVLWSGLFGVAVAEMEKWRGSLVAGLGRKKKERWWRRLGFGREKKN
jgi:hypothetical protein